MPQRQLTAAGVAAIRKPKSGRIEIWDTTKPGFGIRVSSSGVKSWMVLYRVAGLAGNNRGRITLGRAGDKPPALTLTDARDAAETILAKARAGIDPAEKPAQAETAPELAASDITFGWLAKEYITSKCPSLVRGTEIERKIEDALIPAWGCLPLADIRKRHARGILDGLWTTHPASALFLLEIMKGVFNWGLKNRDDELELAGIETNPLQFLEPQAEKVKRSRVLTHNEIRALWPIWSEIGYPFGDLMKLLLLTGARRDEIADLERDEIDQDGRWIKLAPDRNKSDRHFMLPLSDMASGIIANLPPLSEGPFLLSTTGGLKPISGFSKTIVSVRNKSGVDGWSYHDLRRTLRTELSRLKVDPIVRERTINHAPKGLDKVYDQWDYLDEKQQALQAWADDLKTILNPPPKPSRADNVVPIDRKAG